MEFEVRILINDMMLDKLFNSFFIELLLDFEELMLCIMFSIKNSWY